jgi:hypothetical protein
MSSLKQSDHQYRNISGKHFECYTSDPAEFTKAKKDCREAGLSYRIIAGQFYREATKQIQSKEEAIQTVKINNEEYYDLAIEFAKRWIYERWTEFSSEDLSFDMYLVLGRPTELRVLGPVMAYLRDNNLIKHHRTGTYKAKQGHRKPTNIWITIRLSTRQSENRSKVKSNQKLKVVQINAFKQKFTDSGYTIPES